MSASSSSVATRTAFTMAVAELTSRGEMQAQPSTPRSMAPPVLSGSSVP